MDTCNLMPSISNQAIAPSMHASTPECRRDPGRVLPLPALKLRRLLIGALAGLGVVVVGQLVTRVLGVRDCVLLPVTLRLWKRVLVSD